MDADPDVNKELAYFSYEHFYVLYCRFWELDSDHDARLAASEARLYIIAVRANVLPMCSTSVARLCASRNQSLPTHTTERGSAATRPSGAQRQVGSEFQHARCGGGLLGPTRRRTR